MTEMLDGMSYKSTKKSRKNLQEESNWLSENSAQEQDSSENEARTITFTLQDILSNLTDSLISQILSQYTFSVQDDGQLADTIDFVRRLKGPDWSTFKVPRIDNENVVRALVSEINATRLQEMCLNISSRFKTRHAQSFQGIRFSTHWLYGRWKKIVGNRVARVRVRVANSLNYGKIEIHQKSIVVTIWGSKSRDESVVIGAHLDSTTNNRNITDAPGIDDNASGISVLTEVLRSIVNNNYKPEKTIRIIAFAAEELGLLGSRELASQYAGYEVPIAAYLNFDMVGYKGKGKDMYISTDYSNQDLSQFLRLLLNHYYPNITHDFQQCGFPCSDHASWYAYGFPAAMASELDLQQPNSTMNPYYHSSRDNYADGRIMSNFAKLALAFVAEVAKGGI